LIAERIFNQAEQFGGRRALKTAKGEWTYRQLADGIHNAAEIINDYGLEPGEPLGLAFPNSWEFVVFILGAEITGHPAVLLGAALKPREIAYHVQHAGIRKILAAPRLVKFMEEAGGIKQTGALETADCWAFANQPGTAGFLPGDFICQLTSGTNGMSKGAVRTAEAALCEVDAVVKALEITPDDRVLTIPPMHHSFGLVPGSLAALCNGAGLILMEGFIPVDARKQLETEKATLMFAVPFMFHMLAQANFTPPADFSSLRYCVTAGAPLTPEVAREFRERFGKPISIIYGATETGVMCLNKNPQPGDNTVGKPLGNRIMAVFGENNNPLPPGQTGEIRTRSAADSRAYLYPAEWNDLAFKNGWYNTGDFGSMDPDGNLMVSGRKSNMINVAGLKVDPAEVEAVINNIPGVKETVVLGIDAGAGGHVVKAVIVPEGAGVDKKQVIDICKKNLSDFKVPRVIEFRDEIPRSQTGKIIRQQLL
jgi:long-chain acyl-CoA synthetase